MKVLCCVETMNSCHANNNEPILATLEETMANEGSEIYIFGLLSFPECLCFFFAMSPPLHTPSIYNNKLNLQHIY